MKIKNFSRLAKTKSRKQVLEIAEAGLRDPVQDHVGRRLGARRAVAHQYDGAAGKPLAA